MSRSFQSQTASFKKPVRAVFMVRVVFSMALALVWSANLTLPLAAQAVEKQPNGQSSDESAVAENGIGIDEQKEILDDLLANTKLTGLFTVTGKPLTDLTEETYEIESVTKVGSGSTWSILCRIAYGKNDLKAPVPVNIEWAGKTPVIVLDNVGIPLMGTFSARVLFHDGRYAGTWQHDEVGGHLFGTFKKKTDSEKSIPVEKSDK